MMQTPPARLRMDWKGVGLRPVAAQLCLWDGGATNQNEVALLNHTRVLGKATHVMGVVE